MPDPRLADAKDSRSQPPPRPSRAGVLIFAAVFLATGLGILTVVLFANERAHLKTLLETLDLQWPFETERRVPQPVALKGQRLPAVAIKSPAHLLAPPDLDAAGGFVRDMLGYGPPFCAAFEKAGFEISGWQASQFDRTTFECLSETLFETAADPNAHGSFFFTVKGEPGGSINSLRMKLVAPDGADGEAAHATLVKGLGLLIEQTGWTDLDAMLASVKDLRNFSAQYFGLSYRFAQEFTSPNRFNLIILPTNREPPAKRSRAYFDTKDWLPAPDPNEPALNFMRRHS